MEAASAESEVRTLYQSVLNAWNDKNAAAFAKHFQEDGATVGFDGSNLEGAEQIRASLEHIFGHHIPATYLSIVRSVRFLAPDVAMLRAVVGMIPPEQQDIHPAVNAVQTMIATRQDGAWRIALFQNTPAAYHGRPQAVQQLTEELRAELRGRKQGSDAS